MPVDGVAVSGMVGRGLDKVGDRVAVRSSVVTSMEVVRLNT